MSAVAVREEQEKNRFFCLNDSYSSTRDWILSTILRTLVLFLLNNLKYRVCFSSTSTFTYTVGIYLSTSIQYK